LDNQEELRKIRKKFRKSSKANRKNKVANSCTRAKISEVLERFEKKERTRKKSQDLMRQKFEKKSNEELEFLFKPGMFTKKDFILDLSKTSGSNKFYLK